MGTAIARGIGPPNAGPAVRVPLRVRDAARPERGRGRERRPRRCSRVGRSGRGVERRAQVGAQGVLPFVDRAEFSRGRDLSRVGGHCALERLRGGGYDGSGRQPDIRSGRVLPARALSIPLDGGAGPVVPPTFPALTSRRDTLSATGASSKARLPHPLDAEDGATRATGTFFCTLDKEVTSRISKTRYDTDERKLTEQRRCAPTSVHVRRNYCSRSPESVFTVQRIPAERGKTAMRRRRYHKSLNWS